jgi:hypothetical protein
MQRAADCVGARAGSVAVPKIISARNFPIVNQLAFIGKLRRVRLHFPLFVLFAITSTGETLLSRVQSTEYTVLEAKSEKASKDSVGCAPPFHIPFNF